MIQASDGNFYGVAQLTTVGVAQGGGTIFRITPRGQFTRLFTFQPDSGGHFPNGNNPATALVEANDGFLYGTTFDGGATDNGVLFRISKSGNGFEVMHSFCTTSCADGSLPRSLILGHDGNLYGVTEFGGSASCACGTIFRYSTPDTFTTLYEFQSAFDGNPTNLIQGADGNFYGLTGRQVIRFTPPGQITSFVKIPFQGFDPCNPSSGLLQAASGKLYGAIFCYQIEQLQYFEIGPSGAGFQEFPQLGRNFNFVPPLIQGSDGNLWDALESFNSVVAVSPTTGKFIKSFMFDGTNGSSPEAPVVQASDGKLYGTATADGIVSGGQQASGTVWVLNAGLPAPKATVAAFSPASGTVGGRVLIRGDHFIGAKAVTFNGVSAPFKVLNRNFISASVPVGATSGPIAVANPGGRTVSAETFTVP